MPSGILEPMERTILIIDWEIDMERIFYSIH